MIIQNGAPKLLLMAQPLKHPQSESAIAMARYSLFVLKVPLNPKQANKQTNNGLQKRFGDFMSTDHFGENRKSKNAVIVTVIHSV